MWSQIHEKFRWGEDSSEKEVKFTQMKEKGRRTNGNKVEELVGKKGEGKDRLRSKQIWLTRTADHTVQFINMVTDIISFKHHHYPVRSFQYYVCFTEEDTEAEALI